MIITKERIELIRVTFTDDDDSISFREKGKKDTDDEYFIASDIIAITGKEGEKFDKISMDTLLEQAKDKEYIAMIFMGWFKNKETYEEIEGWEELSKYLGISELITISTKIPSTVAKRFGFFASQESTKSDVARKLIYKYVKEKMIAQVDTLMFREEI